MNLKKYKCKNIILLIETPSYKNNNYLVNKKIYEDNIKDFHKYYIKMLSYRKKEFDFNIKLFDFNGEIIKVVKKINKNNILKIAKKLVTQLPDNVIPQNLSLFSDYNKDTTIPNLGFKNKDKALYTLNRIKNKSLKYQVNLVSTMIGRAKSHPYQTKEMRDAIKIFQKWLDNYHKTK